MPFKYSIDKRAIKSASSLADVLLNARSEIFNCTCIHLSKNAPEDLINEQVVRLTYSVKSQEDAGYIYIGQDLTELDFIAEYNESGRKTDSNKLIS